MKQIVPALVMGGLAAALAGAGCAKKPAATGAPAKTAAAVSTNSMAAATNTAPSYASVFEDLPPSKAKDPFFPNSSRRAGSGHGAAPVAVATQAPAHVDGDLHLKAVVHTKSHSQAVINNEIFETGEEASVRVSNGKLRVRCVEIGQDFAVVEVAGETSPKRLTMDQRR